MDPDRSGRLIELFQRALDLPDDARSAFLDRECAGDDALRRRLDRMLIDDAAEDPRLDRFDPMRELDRSSARIGAELGPYRLTALIARGGMGVVYRAVRTDGAFERDVAIKLIGLGDDDPQVTRRFDRERRALARLEHENIARLYDGGTSEDGRPYFVMEYVEGAPVTEHCDRGRLDIRARLLLMVTICRAVHFAHQNLIVHRDLKPGNVLVDARGAPKLLDFGIARVFDAADEARDAARQATLVAATHTRLLTPEYASPEQVAGEPVTTATDVYSLGVILYELLCGQRPFVVTSSNPLSWSREIVERTPTRPSSAAAASDGETSPESRASRRRTTAAGLGRRLRGDLDRITMMALRKEPQRRYRSAAQLADDLERHLDGRPVAAREDSVAYVASRFARRHRTVVAASVAVLAALLFGLVAARRGERRALEEANHARTEATSFQRISSFLTGTFVQTQMLLDEGKMESVRDDLLRYANSVRVEFADDVHLRANLLDELGEICAVLGLLADAESLVVEAKELRRREFGPDSLEYALSLGSLGRIRYGQGDFSGAVEAYREALTLHEQAPVGTHTDVPTASNDLAVALRNLGEIDEAERLHRRALALRRAARPDSPEVAESQNNLAGILLGRGRFEEARAMLDEALTIRRRIHGDDAIVTGHTFANLAVAHAELGDLARARELLERAVEVFRGSRARGLSDLGRALGSLASIDLIDGDHEAAEERLTEALRIHRDRSGPDHPDVADALRALVAVQRAQGKAEEARDHLEEILRIRRASLSKQSPLLGRTLQEYATHLLSMGVEDEAEAALRESVAILSAPPITHLAWLARAELTLGMCLVRRGAAREGRDVYDRGLARLEQAPGASSDEIDAMREARLRFSEEEED